jgi:cytochrome c-type biogenesis protein CcmE
MTRKGRRLVIVLACGAGLCTATALTLNAMSSNIVFFMSPSDIAAHEPPEGRPIRLGGLVQAGSLHLAKQDGEPVANFQVTDGKNTIAVSYKGILPDLFREGQGVVTLGVLEPGHAFKAQEVLAKHDETYMPKDVADALKRSGHWNPAKGAPPPASSWNSITTASATAPAGTN